MKETRKIAKKQTEAKLNNNAGKNKAVNKIASKNKSAKKVTEERFGYIRDFFMNKGRLPNYEEVAKVCGVKSKNAAYKIVGSCIKEGLLKRDKKGRLAFAQPVLSNLDHTLAPSSFTQGSSSKNKLAGTGIGLSDGSNFENMTPEEALESLSEEALELIKSALMEDIQDGFDKISGKGLTSVSSKNNEIIVSSIKIEGKSKKEDEGGSKKGIEVEIEKEIGAPIPYLTPGREVRLLGWVEAGFPSMAEEHTHDTIALDEYLIPHKEASYMLKVKGDSMRDAGIMNGDMVIVERKSTARPGDIVIARIDGEFTMKYYRVGNKKGKQFQYLEAANPAYKPMHPKYSLEIQAVVRSVVRTYGY